MFDRSGENADKSGKSQGILISCVSGNPAVTNTRNADSICAIVRLDFAKDLTAASVRPAPVLASVNVKRSPFSNNRSDNCTYSSLAILAISLGLTLASRGADCSS